MSYFSCDDAVCHEQSGHIRLGGAPVGDRHMSWSSVSDSQKRIEQAKDDWRRGGFPGVPGDNEFIPPRGEEG